MASAASATTALGTNTGTWNLSVGGPPPGDALAERTGRVAEEALDDVPEVNNCCRSDCFRVDYVTAKRPRSHGCSAQFTWPCTFVLIGVIAAVAYRIINTG